MQELQSRLFLWKNICQVASNTFATQCFFTDHLNHKIVNKTTCRTPSANPRQLWAHQLKSFRTVAIIFRDFQDFLTYLAKYFDHFKFSQIHYSTVFRSSTNFVLLCQSRNMVGQFKKAYLHRSIKILHFLTPARIQKCFT